MALYPAIDRVVDITNKCPSKKRARVTLDYWRDEGCHKVTVHGGSDLPQVFVLGQWKMEEGETFKQVALALGMPPAELYRHIATYLPHNY